MSDTVSNAAMRLKRYVCPYLSHEAIRYDGSRGSAIAIARAFPNRIAFDVDRESVLLALAVDSFGREKLHEVPIGAWLVQEPYACVAPTLMTAEHFRIRFTPYPEND